MPSCVRQHISLAPYTSLRIGGTAEYFATVRTLDDLQSVIRWAQSESLPITILGEGTNVLIDDLGIPGVVLHLTMQGVVYEEVGNDEVLAVVGAGVIWDTFVEEVVSRDMWGVENLSGIPGSVGGSPVQNINAYGASVGEVVREVTAYHKETGERVVLAHEDCHFGYRDSFFKSGEGRKYIITQVTFLLSKKKKLEVSYKSSSQSIERYMKEAGVDVPTPADVRSAVLKARKKIGMLLGMFHSAGSFFKNSVVTKESFDFVKGIVEGRHKEKGEKLSPWYWEQSDGTVKISTAFLMECTAYNKTDFKDMRYEGMVGLSPLHTLSIINVGEAKAEDIRAFAKKIIDAVEKEFKVTIETEVCFLP